MVNLENTYYNISSFSIAIVQGHRREDMAVHIRRDRVFEDSFRELHRRNAEEMKNRLYIVFDGEEGQDAGKAHIFRNSLQMFSSVSHKEAYSMVRS